MKTELLVEGMSCSHCVKAVETEIEKISGVKGVKVDLKTRTVTVNHDGSVGADALAQAVEEAGFTLL